VENVVPTIYGSELQACQLFGIPYTIKKYTTLNEFLNIQATAVVPANSYPTCKYFGIGRGGHSMVIGEDNQPLIIENQHKSSDAGAYRQMPFVMRQLNNDLTQTERSRYALRAITKVNDVDYITYWLRRIDMQNVSTALQYRKNENGEVTVTPFVPTASNLTPVPPDIATNGVNLITGDYLAVVAKLIVSMSAAEIEELINVSQILKGSDKYATISELLLCTGFDKTITISDGTSASFNFNEAIGVQVSNFIACMEPAKYINNGFSKVFDAGTNEPLFNIDNHTG
jgi:hypothetical protein